MEDVKDIPLVHYYNWKRVDEMSREDLMDAVITLGKLLEDERSLHRGTLEILRASSKYNAGPSGDL